MKTGGRSGSFQWTVAAKSLMVDKQSGCPKPANASRN